jgi:hypothetical protein
LIELRAPRLHDDGDTVTELIRDIHAVYESTRDEFITSEDMVQELTADLTAPWCEWRRGQPMTQAALARQLKDVGVLPYRKQVSRKHARGYERRQFEDLFRRYLGPEAVGAPQQPEAVDPAPQQPEAVDPAPQQPDAGDPRAFRLTRRERGLEP